MITLIIPEPLQRFSDLPSLELPIRKLSELPDYLKQHHFNLYRILFNEQAQLSGFLNLYLDQKLLLNLNDIPELLGSHQLEIVTALSGG